MKIKYENKDKTIKAIYNQVDRLINMDYEESQLDIAKTLICNTLSSLYDELDALVDYYLESKISNLNKLTTNVSNKFFGVKTNMDDIKDKISHIVLF